MNTTTQAIPSSAVNLPIDVFYSFALHQAVFVAAELGLAQLTFHQSFAAWSPQNPQ